MPPASTRNEFLRLRIAGLSFARIARQLGVSKPTLIAWSRASKPELDSGRAEAQERAQDEISTYANQQLAELERRHGALRQELFSRALRDIPTSCLETLAGELHQRIEHIEHCNGRGRPSEVPSKKEGEQPETLTQPGSTGVTPAAH